MPGGQMEGKTAGKLSSSEEVLHQCSGPLSSDTPIRIHPRTSILLEISLASSFQQLQLLRRGKWRKKKKKKQCQHLQHTTVGQVLCIHKTTGNLQQHLSMGV